VSSGSTWTPSPSSWQALSDSIVYGLLHAETHEHEEADGRP
jgi:hypothetical protein